jgi:hypothetical protein
MVSNGERLIAPSVAHSIAARLLRPKRRCWRVRLRTM